MSKGRLTDDSRIILWVQPPVKELPTFPFLGFYSWDVTDRHKMNSIINGPHERILIVYCQDSLWLKNTESCSFINRILQRFPRLLRRFHVGSSLDSLSYFFFFFIVYLSWSLLLSLCSLDYYLSSSLLLSITFLLAFY